MTENVIPPVFVNEAAGGDLRYAQQLWDKPVWDGWTPCEIWEGDGNLRKTVFFQKVVQFFRNKRVHPSALLAPRMQSCLSDSCRASLN